MMSPSESNGFNFSKSSSIKAVIFDMDGTLVDSEPLWKEAEIEVFNRAGLHLTEDMIQNALGLNTIDAVKFWLSDLGFNTESYELFARDINEKAEELIKEKGKIMTGVDKVLEFFKSQSLPIAIASASRMSLIESVVKKHGLENYFQLLYSDENEPLGKPNPGIFLSVAAQMNVDPQYCLVFEDSVNGILAAKAANMKVVAFLSTGNLEDTKYDIADMKLESFHNFGTSEYKRLKLHMKNH
jgi:mannitol-1-/sugar-/sorbitol-6-/2-deoxyglucose-6-phosphatase